MRSMTPHRRRCLIKAILEIKGALSVTGADGRVSLLTSEALVVMQPAELLALYIAIEKSFDSANITEPHGARIEDLDTIVFEVDVDDDQSSE